MTDAFKATFSDFRIIKGRKQAQIVLECPLEQADAALAVLGGVPNPASERWVAVCRLEDTPAPKVVKRERLTSERAAMLCRDPAFQTWMYERHHGWGEFPGVVERLRSELQVASRAELDTDPEARKRFEILENEFNAQTGRIAHVR